ncbi:hypothetical protein G6F50_013435 [Rhizopus delemar]|uniref:Uncharacterized protein n=1 Tax=Rhizopus delemar TaxID=936053 RepID=A0A9P6YHW9_9FUNG|nr:hypothetical protein G6F50_013435 [Rhizopus delemar]
MDHEGRDRPPAPAGPSPPTATSVARRGFSAWDSKRQRGSGCFYQTCVEETVSIVVTWQALACHAFAIHAECGAQRLRLGIRMPLEKRAHLVDVLGTQDRAGRIQQHAARAQHRPAGFQQARLHSHQRIDVLGAAVEHDIRLAADHAGGRTRCIQQDRVERHAIPPGTGIAGISGQGLRVFAHAGTGIGVTGARQAPGVDIQRQQSQARVAFQQVRRFATGRCAGIQYARAGSGGQCIRRTLRRQVLHRQRARQCRLRPALPGLCRGRRAGGWRAATAAQAAGFR